MLSSKLLTYVAHTGVTFEAASEFTGQFVRWLHVLGVRDVSFKRIGRYTVTIVVNGIGRQSLVIGELELNTLPRKPARKHTSRYFEQDRKDCLAQLAHIEGLLAGHPLERGVRAAIAIERARLD